MSGFGERRYDIPEIPDNVRKMTGTLIILLIIAIAGVVVVSTATIRRAEGEALAMIIEANSTAKVIEIITLQMTDEYASYLWLQQWDGRLPVVMTRDEQGLIIDASDFINP